MIEESHSGIKPCCGIERAQVRKARAIKGHLQLGLRAFLRLQVHRLRSGVSWYEAKWQIIRLAIRFCPAHPTYTIDSTA